MGRLMPSRSQERILHDRSEALETQALRNVGIFFIQYRSNESGDREAMAALQCSRAFLRTSCSSLVQASIVEMEREAGGSTFVDRQLGMGQNETTRAAQVLVHVSIYQGSILGTLFLTHSHLDFGKS